MKTIDNKEEWFSDLLLEGTNILHRIKYINDTYRSDFRDGTKSLDYITNIKRRYGLWRADIQEGLSEHKIDQILTAFFWRPDGVKWMEGGHDYDSVTSQESQEILNKIYEQTEIKLDKLSDLAKIISSSELNETGERSIHKKSKGEKAHLYKFPYKLPAGTRWENFIIKFEDNENIVIKVNRYKHNTSYKEMGLVGGGNNPDHSKAWNFLMVLAKLNGEITIKDPEARAKYKKQKEFLSNSLREYFSLDYDPFYPYKSSLEKGGNSYKIKLTLIPPNPDNGHQGVPEDQEDQEDKEDKDDLGIKSYLDEQAPQIYEKDGIE